MDFMPNRQLADNIHRTLNVIIYTQQQKTKAAPLSIYLEKAFDSVNIKYLQQVLIHMSFGNKFLNIISAIYTKPTTVIKANGFFSDTIPLKQGTR